MKIIITESQYKKLLSEDYRDEIEHFKKVSNNWVNPSAFLDVFHRIFYLNDEKDINTILNVVQNDRELYNIFLEKFKSGYFYNTYLKDYEFLYPMFDYIIEDYSMYLVRNKEDVINNFYKLVDFKLKLPYSYRNNFLIDLIESSIDRVIPIMFNKYPAKDAVRKLSIVTDKLSFLKKRTFKVVKKYAEDNGLLLIPKDKGFTFNRKENSMVRDVINYLKDPSEKIKTKTGFLKYIGSSLGGGQHATFWSALNKSGIIQKIGSGNNVTYTFGPNYDEWENGNLIAF
jgi:hypothetical protein